MLRPPLRALLVAAAICGSALASPANADTDLPRKCYPIDLLTPDTRTRVITVCIPVTS